MEIQDFGGCAASVGGAARINRSAGRFARFARFVGFARVLEPVGRPAPTRIPNSLKTRFYQGCGVSLPIRRKNLEESLIVSGGRTVGSDGVSYSEFRS